MAVTGTSLPDGAVTVLGVKRLLGGPDAARECRECFDQRRGSTTSEPEVTVPSLPYFFDETSVEQPVCVLAR